LFQTAVFEASLWAKFIQEVRSLLQNYFVKTTAANASYQCQGFKMKLAGNRRDAD